MSAQLLFVGGPLHGSSLWVDDQHHAVTVPGGSYLRQRLATFGADEQTMRPAELMFFEGKDITLRMVIDALLRTYSYPVPIAPVRLEDL